MLTPGVLLFLYHSDYTESLKIMFFNQVPFNSYRLIPAILTNLCVCVYVAFDNFKTRMQLLQLEKIKCFDFFNKAYQKRYHKVIKLLQDLVFPEQQICHNSSSKVSKENSNMKMPNSSIIKIHIYGLFHCQKKTLKMIQNSQNVNYFHFQTPFHPLKLILKMAICPQLHYNFNALQSIKLVHSGIAFP